MRVNDDLARRETADESAQHQSTPTDMLHCAVDRRHPVRLAKREAPWVPALSNKVGRCASAWYPASLGRGNVRFGAAVAESS